MAVTEQDLTEIQAAKNAALTEIEAARRGAVRQVIREIDADHLLDHMQSFPERIRGQQAGAAAARQAVQVAEAEVQLQESVLIAEIAEATNPQTGKAAFSNDGARKGELIKRKSISKAYQAALKDLNTAEEALRSAEFDLTKLTNEFSAARHVVDFKREMFRALVS